jgi:hypothetical protein
MLNVSPLHVEGNFNLKYIPSKMQYYFLWFPKKNSCLVWRPPPSHPAVPSLGWLATGHSLWRPRTDPRSVHVGFTCGVQSDNGLCFTPRIFIFTCRYYSTNATYPHFTFIPLTVCNLGDITSPRYSTQWSYTKILILTSLYMLQYLWTKGTWYWKVSSMCFCCIFNVLL